MGPSQNDLPLVSIVITTYHEDAKRYLDLCVESINNLNYPKEKLDIVICGRCGYAPQYEGIKTVFPPEMGFYSARGVNYGIASTNPNSEYILYANDDVIFTRNCIGNFLSVMHGNKVIANAISPCDNGIAYNLVFGYPKNGQFKQIQKRFNKYEDFDGDFKEMMNADSIYPHGAVKQDFLCIYATMIPRAAWLEIGQFDENFKIGFDDTDWSFRAKQHGWELISVLNALIFHFGGASNKVNDEMHKSNVAYFKKKWGALPSWVTE